MAESKKASKSEQVVLAPLVSIKAANGDSRVYLYRGASVEGFDSDDVKRLVDLGLVGDASDDEDIVPGVGDLPA
jgi:hypothetical protein